MKPEIHHGDREARSFRSSIKVRGAAVLILLLLISVPRLSGEQLSTVEFAALLANPTQFHGKTIEVNGFLVQKYENSALYADDKWTYQRNGVWITSSPELRTSLRDLNLHYVIVTGIFDANAHGHMGAFKGTLTVKKIMAIEENRKQRKEVSLVSSFKLLPSARAARPPGAAGPRLDDPGPASNAHCR